MKDLVRVSDLSPDGLARLLNLAAAAKRSPHAWSGVLAGDTVVCYFAKPSTRTRLSFAAAVARLGGVAEFVGPSELQLGRGETIEDTARVISRYTRAFVIRTFADEDIRCFAENASIPVVNALSDAHHPCQALADLLTLREHFGSFENLKVAYVGDGNNVAHSLLEACALAGIDIAVATPAGYAPAPEVVATAKLLALDSGAKVVVTTTRMRRLPARPPSTRMSGCRWAQQSPSASSAPTHCSHTVSTTPSWPKRAPTPCSCTACPRIGEKRSRGP